MSFKMNVFISALFLAWWDCLSLAVLGAQDIPFLIYSFSPMLIGFIGISEWLEGGI